MHKEFVEQNYLETIFILYLDKKEVRNKDIVEKLGLARATVTHMLKSLEQKGYIKYGDDKIVKFTSKGKKIAEKLYEKHLYFTKLLMYLGIDKETAELEACQIEHSISNDSFEKIKYYFDSKI